jgi:hypothetical protein
VTTVVALSINFGLFLLDRSLPEYVDESDNLVGGSLISNGYRLYVDYFSQHMPFPYYAAAVATRLGAVDLVTYRTFFAVFVTLVLGAAVVYFRTRLSSVFLFSLVVLIALGHPIFSGYMLLGDHFFALALLLLVLFVLAFDVSFSIPQQIAISLCCFVAIHSTLISMYPLALIAAYYVVRTFVVGRGKGTTIAREALFAVILAAPHVVLLGVLVWQGTLAMLVEDAIVFNQQYYSHYDIGGDPVSILRNSLGDFTGIVVQYLRPSGLREVETVLLVSNIAAVAVAWRLRGALFAAFYLLLVVLSRMRGPGYHGSPYFLVSFASMALVLSFAFTTGARIVKDWRPLKDPRKLVLPAVLALYVAFAGLFVHDIAGFYRRLPRGQDLDSAYARAVLATTEPTDRIWVAPNGPYVYLLSRRLPASTYAYYQPWQSDSPRINATILHDLQTARPPVIVYEAQKHIEWNFPLPTPAEYGGAVYAYIQDAYVPATPDDPVLSNVYLRRDEADALRARLPALINSR